MNENIVTCPYNPAHRVSRLRIQAHIVKCEKKYPELKICPYNATHRYPDNQILEHINNCPSRDEMYPPNWPPTKQVLQEPKKKVQKEYQPHNDSDECWD